LTNYGLRQCLNSNVAEEKPEQVRMTSLGILVI